MTPRAASAAARPARTATERFKSDKLTARGRHPQGARRPARRARCSTPCTRPSASTRSPTRNTTHSKPGSSKWGTDGEWPLFLDVWLEHTVEDVNSQDRPRHCGHHRRTLLNAPHRRSGIPPGVTRSKCVRDEEGTPLHFQRPLHRYVDGNPYTRNAPGWRFGTPTAPGSTPSTRRASRNGTFAVTDHRRRRRALQNPHHGARRRTRSPPTGPAGRLSVPQAGTPGAPRTSTSRCPRPGSS